MHLDLRVPLGWLFLVLGLVLVAQGTVSGADVQGVNVNLVWGIVLVAFGGGALGLHRWLRR